jgi:tRNA A-37 threonylcarbamoyl transferase component Bud32
MRSVVLYARSSEWRAVIERADELIASPDFHALKSEGRTLAGFLDRHGVDPVFIKRVDIPSWSHGIYARIRGSRAARSLAGAAMLSARGFAHPEPLAAMDTYQAGAIRASYVLSRALPHADTLSRFALGPNEIKGRDVRRRKRISDTVAKEVRRLHDSGLYTRDLQETNIMVEDDQAGGFKVYFIDLEDFRQSTTVSWERRILNLVHLDRSIGRFLCRAARLDFLYAYLGKRPTRAEARKIVGEILASRSAINRRKYRDALARERAAISAAGGVS